MADDMINEKRAMDYAMARFVVFLRTG